MKFYYGKVVLITGASSGIGKVTAQHLAGLGYRVYGTSRKAENGNRTFSDENSNGFIEMVNLDVCDNQSAKKAVEYVIEQEGRIDVLINNAGFGISGAIEETTEEEALAQFNTNFFGMHRMCRNVLPIMRKQKKGLIINIGSVAGQFSIPYQSMYSASKYAMESYTESLRMEVRDWGIRAVIIEPGDTRTGFTDNRYYTQESENTAYPKSRGSIEKMEKDERNGDSPKNIAKIIGRLLNKKNPPPYNCWTGLQGFCSAKRIFPSRLIEFILTKMYA